MKIKRKKVWVFSLWRLPNQVFFSPRIAGHGDGLQGIQLPMPRPARKQHPTSAIRLRQPSLLRTKSFTILPSARPATLGMRIFITRPISFREVAPASETASPTVLSSSSKESCCGRKTWRTRISSSSFWARSARPPFPYCSTESCRCYTRLDIT